MAGSRIERSEETVTIGVICLPSFNALATMAFLDPFRIANYLSGTPLFRWQFLSADGEVLTASNGTVIHAEPLTSTALSVADVILVSASWTPESYSYRSLTRLLKTAARRGTFIAGIDTGSYVLATAGLLKGRRATVHYEHIDALIETFPDVEIVEDLFVLDDTVGTCCGGAACVDFALHVLQRYVERDIANAAARYMFHDRIRSAGEHQIPQPGEPFGHRAPEKLRRAIREMEQHLEDPLSIPDLAERIGLSQRQLERLFKTYTRESAVRYYVNARLDRARGLITQTDMPVTEVAIASGFPSPENFSRAYRRRFGLSPRDDRVEGRIPFEFRAWPMHSTLRASKKS